jgi:polar amino acid transport system substrate-binding protein
VSAALAHGKHVFVEKPLVRDEAEMARVLDAYAQAQRVCFVGFNRRYAPGTVALLESLEHAKGPRQIVIRVNAGPVESSWLADPEVGGGALVGEGCHFVDLASALAGEDPVGVTACGVPRAGFGPAGWTSFVLTLDFAGGSTATVIYSALGDPGYSKERVEVYCGGAVGVIEDFRRWVIWEGRKKRVSGSARRPAKGHAEEIARFVACCQERGRCSDGFRQSVQSMAATFAAVRALGSGQRVAVPAVVRS